MVTCACAHIFIVTTCEIIDHWNTVKQRVNYELDSEEIVSCIKLMIDNTSYHKLTLNKPWVDANYLFSKKCYIQIIPLLSSQSTN